MSDTEIFNAAVKLPLERRATYLDQACGTNHQLRREVESLLQAHDQPGGFLQSHLTRQPVTVDQPLITEEAGTIIGPYKLLQQIGEGVMGVVYMAEQQEPVRRKVALKIIKPAMDSEQVIARFEAERQALAMKDHQNIAKIFDAGTTQSVRPYFVMELVNGLPLTKFCDQAKLGIRERLELFVPICQAVQHAHQKGIIHRDLKPSNILVTIVDGRGVPKVIDFGVAKATAGQLTEASLFTQFGAVVGTFEYMSPEQAGFASEDIDTRADIYSLGVILYELLTGLRPLDAKRLRKAALTEMVRIIKEEEPSKPSTRISTDESAPSLAALRHTEPKKLTALLRGELDCVAMKCLEKQRDRRYETANALARDIQRYLADEMVEARPPSAGYRLRKFARKHRAALASATAIAVLLVAGLSVSLWQMFRAIAAEQQANQNLNAEQQARQDETRARQQAFAALHSLTADVVERKFAQGTVLTEDDRAFLRGIIAQFDAFAAIKGDDVESRAMRAEVRLRVGVMRKRLGELKQAETDHDQAVSIFKQLADDSPSQPEFREHLALSQRNRGALLHDTGRFQEAEHDFDQAMSIYKQLVDDFPSRTEFRQELASCHNNRGILLSDARHKEAEKDYDQALSIYKQLADEFPARPEFREDLAKSHDNRGFLVSNTGRLPEAEKEYDQALSIYWQLAADFPNRPEYRHGLAHVHDNRASLLKHTGRLPEAEQEYGQALSISKQLAADFPARPEFRQHLANCHLNRGVLLSATGRPQEAEKDFDQAISIGKQLVDDFPSRPGFRRHLASSHNNRGNLLKDTGRPQEAEKDFDQALSVRKQLAAEFPSQPEFRKDLATSYYNLGILLSRTKRPKEAEKDVDRALSIQKQLADDFPSRSEFRRALARSLNGRGNLLATTDRLKEAEQDWDQALFLYKQLVADLANQPDIVHELAGTCDNLARLHKQQGNWAAAKRLLLDGQPHHLAALKANPRHPEYRLFYRNHLATLSLVYAGLLEQADVVRTAETRRDLGWHAPGEDAYDAACFVSQCVPIVAKHDKLDDKQRKEAVQFYGDAAMKLLREGANKGFKDAAYMKKDTDLDPLRQREDFKQFIAELEGKG